MKRATTNMLVSVKAIIMLCLDIVGLLRRARNWLASFKFGESPAHHLMRFSNLESCSILLVFKRLVFAADGSAYYSRVEMNSAYCFESNRAAFSVMSDTSSSRIQPSP